jgi:hypothetical protein
MFINIKKRLQMEVEERREENLMEVCKGRIITKHVCNHLLPLLFFFVTLPLLLPSEHQFVV